MRSVFRSALRSLPLLAAPSCDDLRVAGIGTPLVGVSLPVAVSVHAGVDSADVQITLDGQNVRALFTAARELGIPRVQRGKRASGGLEQVPAPLAGNIRATRVAGRFHFDFAPTPTCVAHGLLEGHHGPQRATEGRQQILEFFSIALARERHESSIRCPG